MLRIQSIAAQLRGRAALGRLLERLAHLLPIGQSLPVSVWNRRHSFLLGVLWLHVVFIFAFGAVSGQGTLHSLGEAALVAGMAMLAGRTSLARSIRAAIATLALVTCSAILVHQAGGLIELHFHFFIMLSLIALYHDWPPFLLSIAFVVVHHGVLGVAEPHEVYNHPDAWVHPWKWAAIHGTFVVAASAVNLAAWRASERAFQDPLTALANLVLFRQRLDRALKTRVRSNKFAVLFLDIDDFKTVNDSFGHMAGDALLVVVAERLLGCVKNRDVVARMGGDEFAVLLRDCAGTREAQMVAEHILASLQAPIVLERGEVFVNASIGIVSPGGPYANIDELLRDADVAMYQAKAQGKGRHAVFEGQMHTAVQERGVLKADLRRAVLHREFNLDFQPIVHIASGQITEVEALVRWNHPDRGRILPAAFIPLAEETGLIVELGRWVLVEACAQLQAWDVMYPESPSLVLNINLSAREFVHPDLVSAVAGALEHTGLASNRLRLEITESVLMDQEATRQTIQGLSKIGVRLALDDFGTGYSSLSYLRHLPVDTVKIDQSFVQMLDKDEATVAIVQSVTGLAHALGMSVTAEGIESAEQMALVRSLGCDYAQGFHLAKPLSADSFTLLLESRSLHDLPSCSALLAT